MRRKGEGGSWIMDYRYDEAGHKQGRLWRTNTGIVEYYYRYYYPGTTVVLFSITESYRFQTWRALLAVVDDVVYGIVTYPSSCSNATGIRILQHRYHLYPPCRTAVFVVGTYR